MAGPKVSDALKSLLHWLAEYAPALESDEFLIILDVAKRMHGRVRAKAARREERDEEPDLSAVDRVLNP